MQSPAVPSCPLVAFLLRCGIYNKGPKFSTVLIVITKTRQQGETGKKKSDSSVPEKKMILGYDMIGEAGPSVLS